MRYSLTNLLLFILLVAISFGIYQAFWGPMYVNARILFAINLAFLTTSTLKAFYSHGRWRSSYLGYASFGWVYLALVLHGGFGFPRDIHAPFLAKYSMLGVLLGFMCAVVAWLFIPGTAIEQLDAKKSQHECGNPESLEGR